MYKLILSGLIGLLCSSIQAGELYLDIHGLSHHPVKEYITNTHTVYNSEGDVLSVEETANTRPFNQLNRGLGLTYALTPTSSLIPHPSLWAPTTTPIGEALSTLPIISSSTNISS